MPGRPGARGTRGTVYLCHSAMPWFSACVLNGINAG